MSDDVQNNISGVSAPVDSSERLFNQQNVNDILAARLARQEETMNKKFEEERAKLKSSMPNEEAIAARVHADLDAKYKRQVEEQQQAMYAEKYRKDKETFKDLVGKVDLGDYQDKTGLLNPENNDYLPLQIAFANIDMENKSEILKELSKKPGDILTANLAAREGNVTLLKAMFDKVSEGVIRNKEALSSRKDAYEPISHLKTSSGGSSNGEMTKEEARKAYKLNF
jgi:hypothetical protein